MKSIKQYWYTVHAFSVGLVVIIAVRLFDFAFVFYSKVRDRVRKLLPRGKRT